MINLNIRNIINVSLLSVFSLLCFLLYLSIFFKVKKYPNKNISKKNNTFQKKESDNQEHIEHLIRIGATLEQVIGYSESVSKSAILFNFDEDKLREGGMSEDNITTLMNIGPKAEARRINKRIVAARDRHFHISSVFGSQFNIHNLHHFIDKEISKGDNIKEILCFKFK